MQILSDSDLILTTQIRLFFIERCVKSVVEKMPGTEDIVWSTTRPEIDVLPKHRTDWQSIRPIMKEENSVANNIDIIEDIFQR